MDPPKVIFPAPSGIIIMISAEVPALPALSAAPPVQGRTPRPHLALDAGRHQLGQDVAGPQGTDAVPPPGLLWGWYTELFRKLGYPNSWLVYKGESEKFNG